ncbi:Lead, cadmium, zinc and mercury transporting ATPase; Copper-translocating P-type ATPase [hydrothermal vent metagenome]|uniref:Lead, cadmium, zinc and mercury transporting ATPase Copper-translocating P-type ATPase n=1 Tax=hydrothermal vent metagenome TaxID=652676 RepID=A0A3B1C3F7_9ZZZZ
MAKENSQVDYSKLTVEESLKQLNVDLKNGLSQEEVDNRLKQFGPNALEEKKESSLLKFLSYFWGPIPWMIEIAAILSAAIQHWPDFFIILFLLLFNASVGFWQEHQAASAVEALKKQLAMKGRAKRNGKWMEVDSSKLVPGDIVRIRPGDIIPADTKLVEGDYLSVDQSALTGESLPVTRKAGEIVFSGSIAKQGEMVALVTTTGKDTFFGQTAKLVSEAKSVSHFQKAVLKIGDYLIYLSLGLAAILVIDELFRASSLLTLIQFTLILVVAAIPAAMPAVLSVTMAIGAMVLAKKKAIVTRLESIEEMAGMDILCSDKTGTLTQNKLTLGEPALFGVDDPQEVILVGALASKAENQDAIDLAVIAGLSDPKVLEPYNQQKFFPFDPVHKRTEADITAKDGTSFKVTKGAPQVVFDMCNLSKEKVESIQTKVDEYAKKGYRTLGVARTDENNNWKFLGLLPLFDPPREDSASMIKRAQEHGIEVKMVTGDNAAIGKQIASELGLKTNIHTASEFFKDDIDEKDLSSKMLEKIEQADGFAEVFPKHKYEIVKALQARGHISGMTGDGVNDAPALKQANIGIAVSGATDAARAAAALVLTAPGLSVIIKAVEEARMIFERMNSYAIYRITETIRIMFFVVLAMMVFNFYPITSVMIILLAVLNDLPIMTIAYDNTWLDPKPVRWDMHRVLTLSTTLGLLGVIETFLLLAIAKVWLGLDVAHLQSFIYLKLAVAGHMTLFVVRTKRPFLSKPYPAKILLFAILGTQVLAACIVGFGIFVPSIPWSYVGLIWGYCIIWAFIEDWTKLQVYKHLNLTGKRHTSFLKILKTPLHEHGYLRNK